MTSGKAHFKRSIDLNFNQFLNIKEQESIELLLMMKFQEFWLSIENIHVFFIFD